ncbi:two component transcriptional regulator, LuxR family protein [Calothrix sp. NIES-4071]|nr:two component transcriptional regulator, LuxR family protein [Calothrix sp. NIES-4071]BAZ57870.1 two component transcriptional regulator, LuxR family protein [Calothrix sp. NIES-4105]
MSQGNIRVLIADNHPIVLAGLAMIIEYEPGIEMVAQANNGIEAVQLFRQLQPDVTLMDLRMPEMNGVDAIITIRQEFPNACIIVLTIYDGDEDIYRGLQAGARGYLLKDAPTDELLLAIRKVYAGNKYVPAEVGEKLAERFSNPQLSKREQEVLRLVASGKNNLEIATALGITEGTVKFHINNLLSKLKVSDRTTAAILALKRGIANL